MNIPTLPLTLLAPLVAWTGQVLVLVAAGAAAALAIANPKARLRLWQGLLLMLLLLPAIEPWTPSAQLLALEQTASSEIITTQAAPVASSFHWRPEYWIWLIAAGAVVRLIWLAAGFARLRRYRQHARLLPEPLRFASDGATWYVSESVPGPVTYGGFFGWTRAVILLPARVLELPAETLEAIQCHELIHVRRGDWAFVLAEALVRSLLWFHPAIWLVLGRIQLAREQVVDQEAIGLLQNRDAYLDALVAVAEHSLQPDLAPAPLFLRKRHLAERVNAVIKEIKMTRSRMVAGITAVCCALPVAAFAAMWLFPFVSQAQTSPDSPGIAVDAGAVLLHRAPVHGPEGSTIAGTVVIQATIDTKGEVSDAHVLSGPDELRKEVLSSVLQWHYKPGPTLAQISIQFSGAGTSATAQAPSAAVRLATAKQAPGVQPSDGTLKSIEFAGISAEAEQELRSRLNVREGDTLNRQDTANILATVKAYDSHLNAMFTIAANGGITQLRIAPGGGARGGAAPTFTATAAGATTTSAAIPPATAAAAAVGAYPAGNGVSSPIPTYKVDPQYTEEARAAKWQGSVLLSTVIDENGVPQNIQVVRPLGLGLDQKAIEAVSQWRFNPGLKDGAAVKVQAQIEVTFRLL